MTHPLAQGLGRDIDELHLVGGIQDPIRDRLPDDDARDPLDDVVVGLDVLHIKRGNHIDPGVTQVLDILPALLVIQAWGVRVSELIHERHFRVARKHRREIHLLQHGAAVRHLLAGDDLEAGHELVGARPAVGLDVGNHDVFAALAPLASFPEHREGLARTRGGGKVDLEVAPRPSRRNLHREPC